MPWRYIITFPCQHELGVEKVPRALGTGCVSSAFWQPMTAVNPSATRAGCGVSGSGHFVVPPVKLSACRARCLVSGFRSRHLLTEAPPAIISATLRHGPPDGIVAMPNAYLGVCDFMPDGCAYLAFAIQRHDRQAQGDRKVSVIAASESALGPVEPEPPFRIEVQLLGNLVEQLSCGLFGHVPSIRRLRGEGSGGLSSALSLPFTVTYSEPASRRAHRTFCRTSAS